MSFPDLPSSLRDSASTMNTISEEEKALQESDFFLKKIETIPSELIDRIIMTALFSTPLGSHDALHTLESLSRDENYPHLKTRIAIVFESRYLRNEIELSWQLCPSFDHAEHFKCIAHNETSHEVASWANPHCHHEKSGRDLASWAISNCYPCFSFLLDHGSVKATSYCKNGQSFFYCAMLNMDIKPLKQILSLMDPKNLFQPYSLYKPGTIFHYATIHQPSFEACWELAQLVPDIRPLDFTWFNIFSISQFAGFQLAEDLFYRGLDLGRTYPDDEGIWEIEFPGWGGVLKQRSPVPLLEWLWIHGHRPPAGYLISVAKYNNLAAASWVLSKTESHQGWREAAYIAACSLHPCSVEILGLILQHRKPKWTADNLSTQDLAIRVVDKVCDEVRIRRCHGQPQTNLDEKELEMNAIRKIQFLRRASNGIGVVGLKVKTKHAGLYQLTAALENMDS